MRILCLAEIDISDQCSGIGKKVLSQYESFSKIADYAVLVARSKLSLTIRDATSSWNSDDLGKVDISLEIYRIALEVIREHSIDSLYIRYAYANPIFLHFLKKAKQENPSLHIAIEIPTYPYDNEPAVTKGQLARKKLDKLYRSKLKAYCDRIVTFSNDRSIFGIECINTANGFDFDNFPLPNNANEWPQDSVSILSVSSMCEWHGLDRLILGIGKNQARARTENLILHMVGTGPEEQIYRNIVDKYGIADRVIFHGRCYGDDLQGLYDSADLCVNTLGSHRISMETLSTLKSREALAKGKPLISSCKIDIIEDGWPYLLPVPANDDPIEIDGLIDYVHALRERAGRTVTEEEIRQYGIDRCSMSASIAPVAHYFDFAQRKSF